ncbi:MAG: AraC family transcriptional regulator [Gammaproteobacteria bacterium]|nr:AraC family transcriptional regulator [Gammaproteobacteria bacterium]
MAETPENLYVALGYLRPMFDYLIQQGRDIQPLLDELGIEESQLSDPDILLDDSNSNEVFELVERLTGDPNVGFNMGRSMQVAHLGVLGMLVISCDTVLDAFELVIRYQDLLGNGGKVTHREEGDEVIIGFDPHPARGEPYCRHNDEFCFAGWVNIGKMIGGAGYKPNRVRLAHEPPADASEQEAFFGCPVEYNADCNAIHVAAHFGQIKLFGGNPQLKGVLEAQAKQRLQALQGAQTDADPVIAKTKQFIADAMAYGIPSVDDAAEQFHTSARTLQRQLEAAGKGYKELVDEVRADLASKYMQDAELSLLDVALMLGFSEQSSFQRAFKRWFDQTPGQYRAGFAA